MKKLATGILVLLAVVAALAVGDGCSPRHAGVHTPAPVIYQSRRVTVWYHGQFARPHTTVSVRPRRPMAHGRRSR